MTTVSKKPLKYKRGQHPNSQANLIPGPPEKLPNPAGYSLTSALKTLIRKNPELRQQIIQSTIEGCILREPTPFREVWDRVEGRLQDQIPAVSIDNRQIHIHVDSPEGRELVEGIAERTRKLRGSDAIQG